MLNTCVYYTNIEIGVKRLGAGKNEGFEFALANLVRLIEYLNHDYVVNLIGMDSSNSESKKRHESEFTKSSRAVADISKRLADNCRETANADDNDNGFWKENRPYSTLWEKERFAIFRREEREYLKIQENAARRITHDDYFAGVEEAKHMQYTARPLWQMLSFGTAAVTLIVLFALFPYYYQSLNLPTGGYLGFLRLSLFFVGAFCAFMAWPKYQPKGTEDKELDEMRRSADEFRRKFRR